MRECEMRTKDGRWIKVVAIPCTEEEFERITRHAVDYKVSRESPPSKLSGETVIYYDSAGKPIAMASWIFDPVTGKENKWFYSIIPAT